MARIFTVRFQEEVATIILNLPTEGGFIKKTLRAESPNELWEGLRVLETFEPKRDKELVQALNNAEERAFLNEAIPAWLSRGNKIKILPRANAKLLLSEEEQEDILNLLSGEAA